MIYEILLILVSLMKKKLFFNTLSIAFFKVFFLTVWLEEGVSTLNKSVHAR